MFKQSLSCLALFKPQITSNTLPSLQHACEILRLNSNTDYKLSFDNLISEIQCQSKNEIIPTQINKLVVETLNETLSKSTINQRAYYYSKLAKCSNWLILYSFINQSEWSQAYNYIKYSKDFNIPVDLIESYQKLLLVNNELELFLNLLSIQYETTPASYIFEFIEKSMDQKKTVLVSKFFEKFIFYTGPGESIKREIIKLNNEQVEKFITFFQENKVINEYSKAITYYMQRLKSGDTRDLLKYNQLRAESRINKFNMYIDKLGPYKVLENGMFNQFKFNDNRKIKVHKQMVYLIDSLTKYFTPNIPTFDQALLIIDFMNGYRISSFKGKFTKGLSPDIQMARIYKCGIERTVDPDPLIIQRYNEIIEKGKDQSSTHLKDGLPKRETFNQRMQKDTDGLPYSKLSLQIVLRVLCNLATQQEHNIEDQKKIVMVSVAIFQEMVQKHKVIPVETCFIDLVRIVNTDSSTVHHIPSIVTIYKNYCRTYSGEAMRTTLTSLGLDTNGHPLSTGN